jgi:hypothetical protein
MQDLPGIKAVNSVWPVCSGVPRMLYNTVNTSDRKRYHHPDISISEFIKQYDKKEI